VVIDGRDVPACDFHPARGASRPGPPQPGAFHALPRTHY